MTEIWPVIHVRDEVQTCEMAAMARRHGCAGVMLISMDGNADNTDRVSRRLVGNPLHKNFKIGVNYLSLRPAEAVKRAVSLGYDATWTDRQMFTRGELSADARDVTGYFGDRLAGCSFYQVFAAVAFKGQDPFPGDSAGLAARYGIIPTTSGPRTGEPPTADKIAKIRRGIDSHLQRRRHLAVASGITPSNAPSAVRAGATHLLVATGISRDFHTFDEDKLRALMDAVSRGQTGTIP